MAIQEPPLPEPIITNASYGIIEPWTTTAVELQQLLTLGHVTSLDFVNIYLKQIEKHNKNDRVLDVERARGSIRGPLHGIPVVVKDNVMTDTSLGMDTTCSSYALVGAKAPNAPIVNRLLKAGMIVIAKANLSQWAGSKGFGMVSGWSAVGGQTQSPYVKGDYVPGDKILGHNNPCGSSSGSAVAVAAGQLEGQKVAFVDPNKRELHPAVCEGIEIVREKTISTIQESGAEVTENVVLPQVDESTWEGEDALETVWNSYLGGEINPFLNEYTEPSVRTIKQLIQWNFDHKDAFPGQQQLENTLKSNLTEEKRQEMVSFIRKIAKDDGFDRILKGQGPKYS
ncbi:hypothetical protein THAR02_05549 [Trichoderma harzianum]|uniref:Amidase domain-containing protein n=1 Tax=Trichoderma harzianum TaxID=5544 RepID=A0A0G0ABG3_TRIHA|nr:hypothetical protein THAR02_05549 [Trichoderma harzianum]